jgi:hypothetical protein
MRKFHHLGGGELTIYGTGKMLYNFATTLHSGHHLWKKVEKKYRYKETQTHDFKSAIFKEKAFPNTLWIEKKHCSLVSSMNVVKFEFLISK